MEKIEEIYQCKIILEHVTPPVWRRIQVSSDISMADFSFAIIDAMGWTGCHLHGFHTLMNEKKNAYLTMCVGIFDVAMRDELEMKNEKLSDWLSMDGRKKIKHDYDFGDGWEHMIVLEKVRKKEPNHNYPQCIAGKRACPPEDIGGPWGYMEYKEGLLDSDDFNPDFFDMKKVYFMNKKGKEELYTTMCTV